MSKLYPIKSVFRSLMESKNLKTQRQSLKLNGSWGATVVVMRPEREADTHLHKAPSLRMSGALPLYLCYTFMTSTATTVAARKTRVCLWINKDRQT